MTSTIAGTDTYVPGDHYVICDICGFQFRRSECKKNWKQQIVCMDDFEKRHPQDLIKVKPERPGVKDARPVPEYYFVGTNEVTPDDL